MGFLIRERMRNTCVSSFRHACRVAGLFTFFSEAQINWISLLLQFSRSLFSTSFRTYPKSVPLSIHLRHLSAQPSTHAQDSSVASSTAPKRTIFLMQKTYA